ncbi:MAG TPA: carboxypeptidase-like regulatory domain-containing protein [Urbifossiella sp.]|nr:carboxypeptidase-like regulatory domain-containing protein [Urbifossiella sp.]
MRRPLFFLLLTLSAVLTVGCGDKLTPVEGTVTYDGTPLDGATVIFINDSGSKSAVGRTDDSGKFALQYDNGPGIPAGTYKVMVTRTKITEGQAPGDPAKIDKDYLAKMKAKEVAKTGGAGPAGFPAVKTGSGPKIDIGDLPAVYGSATSTPLSVTVPVSGPVELKLEKKK